MSEVNKSHPMSLRNRVKKTLKELPLPDKYIILLGVSGGSDSMALMHVLSTLQDECNFSLHCMGVNHNLREEAHEEIKKAQEFSNKLLVPFYKASVFINGKDNVQEKARKERYRVIQEVKGKLKEIGVPVYIATAHHMEDKAETVLLRMIRGTSVAGLNVLEPLKGELLRPMIHARKRDVMLHIERKDVPYSDDPSNAKVELYQRSKVRHILMPLLKEMNPNIVQSLYELSVSAEHPEITGRRTERIEARKRKKELA